MRKTGLGAAALFAVLGMSSGSADAALLITEFMADPSGTDVDREWIEIYNSGPNPVDLTGFSVGDGLDPLNTSTGEGMVSFPNGLIMPAGEIYVIANTADGFNVLYGFLPDFELTNRATSGTQPDNPSVPNLSQRAGWGSTSVNVTFGIANGGDDVGIVDPAGSIVDGSNHGTNTSQFASPATLGGNQSYERVPADQDTNTASDWVVRTTGNATPNAVTIPEPAALSLLGLAGLGFATRRRRTR